VVSLTERGRAQARELGTQLANVEIDLAVGTRFPRTQETIEIALRGRRVPRLVEPAFDEIDAGELDGAPIETYRAWKEGHPRSEPFPHGESVGDARRRYAAALQRLLARAEERTLVVTHELALRFITAAAATGSRDSSATLANAVLYLFDERALMRAVSVLDQRPAP
jgi:broad specificity phosphatase PhoE